MFNIGGMELVVIGVVALVVLGPDKLPGAIRQVGQFVGELRRISQGFQTDLRGALDEAERDAERQKRQATDPASSAVAPAPGGSPEDARAVARAELEAIEGGGAETSEDPVGSESVDMDDPTTITGNQPGSAAS